MKLCGPLGCLGANATVGKRTRGDKPGTCVPAAKQTHRSRERLEEFRHLRVQAFGRRVGDGKPRSRGWIVMETFAEVGLFNFVRGERLREKVGKFDAAGAA